MSWQTTAVAPACKFGREGIDVVVAYDFAGAPQKMSLPAVVWCGIVEAIRAGRLDGLNADWKFWSPAGGLARVRDGYVHLAYGHLHHQEASAPASVWQQIVAAVHAHAVDQLPVIEPDGERAEP